LRIHHFYNPIVKDLVFPMVLLNCDLIKNGSNTVTEHLLHLSHCLSPIRSNLTASVRTPYGRPISEAPNPDVRAEPPRCHTTGALAIGKGLELRDLGLKDLGLKGIR
jgi:hypothetical protein